MKYDYIKLLYLFRDKLIKELYDMSKRDGITTTEIIEYVYQKLTIIISDLDRRRK